MLCWDWCHTRCVCVCHLQDRVVLLWVCGGVWWLVRNGRTEINIDYISSRLVLNHYFIWRGGPLVVIRFLSIFVTYVFQYFLPMLHSLSVSVSFSSCPISSSYPRNGFFQACHSFLFFLHIAISYFCQMPATLYIPNHSCALPQTGNGPVPLRYAGRAVHHVLDLLWCHRCPAVVRYWQPLSLSIPPCHDGTQTTINHLKT